jgi:hypothetical protein
MTRNAWKGALLLAACLAACSGGGGDDGGGACPAGSVASISPSSARVTAGGPAVSFGGGASNCAEMVNWSLSGPGTLDRIQGVPVLYTPPATVATVTTATLAATVGGLTASAIITIDPAVQPLTGKVIAVSGAPVAGAVVRVGSLSATTDADGAFSLPGVALPYDLTATAPDGLLTSAYPGLRRMDPTLVLFLDVDPGFPRSASGAGALSGGAGFPQPAGHEAGVTFKSAEANGTCPVLAGASTFLLGTWWSGPASVAGQLHALQWRVDAGGRPVGYDGYGFRAGVTLVDGSAASGQDLALGLTAATSIAGTIVNPPSNTVGISMFAVFQDGARIRVLPPPSDPSPFPSIGFTSPFSIPTPAVLGGTIDLVGRQDHAGMAYQEVHRHGLPPDATGVALEFGGLPVQDSPVYGATGVGPGTTFSWHSMPDQPVYVVAFRGPAGRPGYDIFTTSQSLTIPAGFPLPSSTLYTWRIRGSSAFSTVEEAAGPGGFFAAAPAYRIAQGSEWSFTTAP